VRLAGALENHSEVRHRLAGQRLAPPRRQRHHLCLLGDHDARTRGLVLIEVEDLAEQLLLCCHYPSVPVGTGGASDTQSRTVSTSRGRRHLTGQQVGVAAQRERGRVVAERPAQGDEVGALAEMERGEGVPEGVERTASGLLLR
jgi:hypothetical protein